MLIAEKRKVESPLPEIHLVEKEEAPKRMKRPVTVLRLQEFNPNAVSAKDLQEMGLPNYVSENWEKYLEKGGRFESPQDVSKIYGLSDSLFRQIQPYINLPAKAESRPNSKKQGLYFPAENDSLENKPPLVNLNLADTIQLKKIRGIGSYFAGAIVNYREKLGGYHDLQQLTEIYYLNAEKLEEIKDYLYLDTNRIESIFVNQIGKAELASHPYISSKLAEHLVKYRSHHGRFEDLNDLGKMALWHDSIIGKIAPYISFE